MSASTEPAFEFEQFRLYPNRQLLLDGAKRCAPGSRAIEILTCLLERAGEMVSKRELLDRVWPGSLVHEANLRVNVGALRKALGDGQGGRRYIVNLAGQGYSFVAPVRRIESQTPQTPLTRDEGTRHNLPPQVLRLLGRDADIQAVALQIPMRRCVTVAGPGGIGKTTLAIAIAERLLPVYDDGVWFIDFSAITDGNLILQAAAQVLGLSLQAQAPLASLVTYLEDKRLLLLFDNCEHVIEHAARLTEAIVQGAPHVSILATSRETLRIGGEWVHWLSPMALPPPTMELTAVQALLFPAIRFFVERAGLSIDDHTFSDADVPVVVSICRKLDGVALAIELIAGRIDMFGLNGLSSVLEDPFLLISEGRRGAFPRQQSLLRMLEWSYRLLAPIEQTILRRLSVFRGGFTLNGAVAIAGGDGIGRGEVYSAVLALSAKSLLTGDGAASAQHHRMLHVTRTFLSHKLEQTDEAATVLHRHAEYFSALLAEAEQDWESSPRTAWVDKYGHTIGDVRAAIDWAFSPRGDGSLGVLLTALALPLGFQLSLIEEFRGRVECALLHSQRIRPAQLLSQMRMNISLANFTHNTKGPAGSRTAALDRANDLCQQLDQPKYQVEPLFGLAQAHIAAGEYSAAAHVAGRARRIGIEHDLPTAVVAAERFLAQAQHFDGEHLSAAQYARRVIDDPAPRLPLAYNPTPVDRRVSMQIVLARILWLQGHWQSADTVIGQALDCARSDGAYSVCPTLVFGAIPIALWNRDDAGARALIALLKEDAKRYTLGFWLRWAEFFDAALLVCAGDRSPLPIAADSLTLETLATFSPALLTLDAAARERNGASGWCSPEIRRAQGEWLLGENAPDAAEHAEGLFREAIDIARQQGAFSWELRAATSLARLWQQTGRGNPARDLITEVLTRCPEPRLNADFVAAQTVVEWSSGDPLSERYPAARRRPRPRGI